MQFSQLAAPQGTAQAAHTCRSAAETRVVGRKRAPGHSTRQSATHCAQPEGLRCSFSGGLVSRWGSGSGERQASTPARTTSPGRNVRLRGSGRHLVARRTPTHLVRVASVQLKHGHMASLLVAAGDPAGEHSCQLCCGKTSPHGNCSHHLALCPALPHRSSLRNQILSVLVLRTRRVCGTGGYAAVLLRSVGRGKGL